MLRILVVDDHADSASVTALAVKQCECDPIVAADGATALIEMARQTFNLVILDYHMPGMSGLDVLRHMHDRSIIANPPPAVMHSADTAVADEAIRQGAVGFIAKGGDFDLFVSQVRRYAGCTD